MFLVGGNNNIGSGTRFIGRSQVEENNKLVGRK